MTAPRRPRIRHLVLTVYALIVAAPVLALLFLRVYQTHLVRQTEVTLAAEAVLIGEAWRAFLPGPASGRAPDVRPPGAADPELYPIEPSLDLSQPLLARLGPPSRFEPPGDSPEYRAGAALKPVLERARRVNLSGARVLDRRGVVVASTGDDLGAILDDLPEVQSALAGRYTAVARERVRDEPDPPLGSIQRRGGLRVFVALPVWQDGAVLGVVRMSRTSVDLVEALFTHRHTLFAAALITLVATLGVALLLSRTITHPVLALTDAARRIVRGERRAPFQASGLVPAELQALSESLDTLTRQLTDRAEYIAEFAANVSHELKTPITSVRGAAELLQDEDMDAAARVRFARNVEADALRMERLVTRLLELARVQSAPAASETVDVRAFFAGLAARTGDGVVWETSGAPERLVIHPDHLESAVRNLVDNAVRHGAGRPVRVTARRTEDDRLCVEVADQGPGISEKNRARVFDRFFTTERDRGGTGLGLAIVAAVARTRGGDVTFESGPGGTTFRLVL